MRLTPHAGRLTTYAAAALVSGALMGRPEVTAFGVAAVAVLAWKAWPRTPSVSAELTVEEERVVEGEPVPLRVRLVADAAVDRATVRVALDASLDVVGGDRSATVSLRPGETRDVVVTIRPRRWGVYKAGASVVAYARGGLVTESYALPVETLRVMPRAEEFTAGAPHPYTRALTGAHTARVSGEGIEPMGVREYRPGDALRRVNWRVTARRGDLHVTEQVPERNAEVVLFLDTYVDRGPHGATTLDTAVRAAAGIADHYLSSMDRVGAVGFGGVLRWLYADAGRVQRHRLLEHLIGTAAVATYADKDVDVVPARALPPRALVIALSPLLDSRAVDSLAHLAHRGYPMLVVDTSPRPILPAPRTWSRDLAQRLWLVERDGLIHRLGELGVPVVPWAGTGTLDVVLAQVARLHARPRVSPR
jgi:uncharacterized protein (DUF58 family)